MKHPYIRLVSHHFDQLLPWFKLPSFPHHHSWKMTSPCTDLLISSVQPHAHPIVYHSPPSRAIPSHSVNQSIQSLSWPILSSVILLPCWFHFFSYSPWHTSSQSYWHPCCSQNTSNMPWTGGLPPWMGGTFAGSSADDALSPCSPREIFPPSFRSIFKCHLTWMLFIIFIKY